MLDSIHTFIKSTSRHLGISEEVIEKLVKIDNELLFNIRLNNGKSFKAYRVQHNNRLGPYKGGVRFHKDVSLDEIRSLATLMSLKTAAVGLPMGGGKGGVVVDPQDLEKSELEELSRKYVTYLHKHIGPDKDVPAPDVNTNSMIIDWMMDEYEKLTGDVSHASFTGKSIEKGGSLGRDAATGRGGVVALAELLSLEKNNKKPMTMAIQGFGNVGSYFATVAEELQSSWHLLAASDSEAAVYSVDGLSAKKLQTFKERRGRFRVYADNRVKNISNSELLSLDVDILILAGLENAVTTDNMQQIKAHYIIEMGNGPVEADAYNYLTAKGKVIMPDIIANAGGVIVSYLEWLQNKQTEHWDEDKVNKRLTTLMKRAVKSMYSYAELKNISLKESAFSMAIKRLSEVYKN